jgi:SAM-dependent methyltransferase
MLIIDLGCGWLKYPATLRTPKARMGNVIGIDVCRYNNDIVASALFTPFKDNISDLVVCRQFLEHVNSVSLIREIWRILKPNGKLLLETPNALYVFRILRALLSKESNPHPEHIQTFTSTEIRNLFIRNGFSVIDISYFNIDVYNPNFILNLVKKTIACITGNLFPMLDRDIRVIARKEHTAKFREYR